MGVPQNGWFIITGKSPKMMNFGVPSFYEPPWAPSKMKYFRSLVRPCCQFSLDSPGFFCKIHTTRLECRRLISLTLEDRTCAKSLAPDSRWPSQPWLSDNVSWTPWDQAHLQGRPMAHVCVISTWIQPVPLWLRLKYTYTHVLSMLQDRLFKIPVSLLFTSQVIPLYYLIFWPWRIVVLGCWLFLTPTWSHKLVRSGWYNSENDDLPVSQRIFLYIFRNPGRKPSIGKSVSLGNHLFSTSFCMFSRG